MKKRSTRFLALALAVMMLALTACGDGGDSSTPSGGDKTPATDNNTPGTGSQTPASTEGDTQVFNVSTKSFGNNYDVQDMGWRWMMGDCYEGLYRNVADESGEHFILAGAESVDVSEDETVYTYHLRKDAKWSDGQPVTAHDYEYGWKRLENPEYGYSYASFLYNVVGAEEYNKGTGSADDMKAVALDDYTFEVTLKVPDPTFEAKLVATPCYPTREDIAEAAGDQWGKDWKLCVYNGPFCMSELVEDNKMVWTKNPHYWDADNTHLETINWYIVTEDSTASTMFDNGELDQLQPTGDYTVKYASAAEAGELQRRETDYPGCIGLTFNFAGNDPSGLMGNAKIRKAISYCIDREEIIEAIYGRYKPAYGYVNPAITFEGESYRAQVGEIIYDEYLEYNNNPEKLQALFQEGLDELGVTTPISDITLSFLAVSNASNTAEYEYMQQTIQNKLGLTFSLDTVGDSAMFRSRRDEGSFDIMTSGWYSDYNDPMDFLYTMYTDSYGAMMGHYSNPKVDELLDSLTGETDRAKRLATYKEVEEIVLLEDAALVPIYYATKDVFLQNWVKDYRTSSFGASAELYITYIEGRGN